MRANYDEMRVALTCLLRDLTVLSGDVVGNSNDSWQQYAKIASNAAGILRDQLDLASRGECEAFLCFPSPADCMEDSQA